MILTKSNDGIIYEDICVDNENKQIAFIHYYFNNKRKVIVRKHEGKLNDMGYEDLNKFIQSAKILGYVEEGK